MRVEVAAHAGFCSGVKAAVDKALDLAEKYGRIYTLGELVHNELVTEFLQSLRAEVGRRRAYQSPRSSRIG